MYPMCSMWWVGALGSVNLDENGNIKRNAITLVAAFPHPDAEVLALFRHQFSVEEGRRLLEAQVSGP